jgi:ABC-type glycerol-3-phosphate transport system substrate-binding protein
MGKLGGVGILRRGAFALVVLAIACDRGPRPLTLVIALLPAELSAYRRVIDDFEAESGRRVVIAAQQYPDIRRLLAAEAAAGAGTIDLAELDVYSLAPSARHVRSLDGPGFDATAAALDPAAVRAGTLDGLRFLPHRVSWQALVYNHAVLGEPPATWEELLAVARAHPGKIGFKGARYEGCTCDVLSFVWAAGGSGESFTDAGARAAFDLFAELAPSLDRHSETFKEATIAEAMARGEIVLHLNWPFAMSLYASQGLSPDPLRSAPLPRGPDGRATVLGGGYLAIPASAPEPEASARLLEYLLSRAVQERLGRDLGWFSARRDVPPGGGDALLAGFAAMRDDVRARPEREDYPALSRLWQRAFRAVAFDGIAPDAALAEAARDLEVRPKSAPAFEGRSGRLASLLSLAVGQGYAFARDAWRASPIGLLGASPHSSAGPLPEGAR